MRKLNLREPYYITGGDTIDEYHIKVFFMAKYIPKPHDFFFKMYSVVGFC